jgi:hypothetical protein
MNDCFTTRLQRPEMKLVLTPALILAFSPGEKGSTRRGFDFSDAGPANPDAGFIKPLKRFLPLLGGEGRGEDGPSTNYWAGGRKKCPQSLL